MAVLPAHAEQAPLSVASSIKPLDIIVRHIGGDMVSSSIILPPSQSLHHAGLRPSQRQVIVDSDIVFVLDPLMESSLAKIIDEEDEKWEILSHSLASHIRIRQDDHDDHDDHDGHDNHAKHDDHHDHHDDHKGHDDHHDDHEGHDNHAKYDDHHDDHEGHDNHAKHDDHHDDHEGHDNHAKHDDHHDEHHDDHDDHAKHDDHEGHDAHGGLMGEDYHIFFSLSLMREIGHVVADRLAAARPSHAAQFEANYESLAKTLNDIAHEMRHALEDSAPNHFIAMHDVSLYLEADLPITATGFLLTHNHSKPSARHLRELQEAAKKDATSCIFYEPQLSKRLVGQLSADMNLPLVTLDPLGSGLAEDASLTDYWRSIATALEGCFKS